MENLIYKLQIPPNGKTLTKKVNPFRQLTADTDRIRGDTQIRQRIVSDRDLAPARSRSRSQTRARTRIETRAGKLAHPYLQTFLRYQQNHRRPRSILPPMTSQQLTRMTMQKKEDAQNPPLEAPHL